MHMLGNRCADGPGGRDCYCCGQPPGKARRVARRSAKRRERREWKRGATRVVSYDQSMS